MDQEPQVNHTKIRVGLAMVAVVVAAAILLFFLVDDGLGKAIMLGVALAGIIRAYLLARSLRSGDA